MHPTRKPKVGSNRKTPLSKLQKAVLCQLAARAFKHLQSCYAASVDGVKLEDWRRSEQLAETGLASLCDMRNGLGHYEALSRRYQTYLGELGHAFDLALRDTPQSQEVEQYLHTLHELALPPLSWAYVLTIARAKFRGRKPETLTPEELLQLIMTIQRARRAKAAKELVEPAGSQAPQPTQPPQGNG